MNMKESIQNYIELIYKKQSVIKTIIKNIADKGGAVLLVGGAVRDFLLGIESSDLDFEIYNLSFDKLEKILKQCGPVSFIGKSFGVLRLHGLDIDWSLPRKDSSGRKPEVSIDIGMSYQDAFARRDVTINAMGINMETGELIDPYNGQQDLDNKILRSPNNDFFIEDPLRLFRVMQFVGRFEMEVDESLNKLCQSMDISKVSKERIEQEFTKLFLKSKRPSLGLQWLQKIKRFQEVFPMLNGNEKLWISIDCVAQLPIEDQAKIIGCWVMVIIKMHVDKCDRDIKNDSVQKLPYEFCSCCGKKFKKTLSQYICSKTVVRDVAVIVGYIKVVMQNIDKNLDQCIKWLAFFIQPFSIAYFAALIKCIYGVKVAQKITFIAEKEGVLNAPIEPLIKGKDLLHFAQGKELGELVKKGYRLQLSENIVDKLQLTQLLKDG